MYYVDAPTVTVRVLDRHRVDARSISSPSCSPPRPICWPAGRASRSAPTCARGRASSRRCWTSRASPSPTRAGAASRAAAASGTRATPVGDCIDCGACVTACPTGIDIRDGIQLECINCGLCIDACNHVMERTGQPKWLITWDTLADQAAKAAGRQSHAASAASAHADLSRARCSSPWSVMARGAADALDRSACPCCMTARRCSCALRDGGLRNGYTVKIVNKTPNIRAVRADAPTGLHGARRWPRPTRAWDRRAGSASAGRGRQRRHLPRRWWPASPAASGRMARKPIDFVLRNTDTGEQTVYHSLFMGPGEADAASRAA